MKTASTVVDAFLLLHSFPMYTKKSLNKLLAASGVVLLFAGCKPQADIMDTTDLDTTDEAMMMDETTEEDSADGAMGEGGPIETIEDEESEDADASQDADATVPAYAD